MRFIGIDLAWQGEKNPSALAAGSIIDNCLVLESIEPALFGLNTVKDYIMAFKNVKGIAIDAPLVMVNETGQRICEKQVSQAYGSRKAGCHTSNLSLYPDALSVELSTFLLGQGYQHINGIKWQLECYPHPAIIECFNLPERLLYKKGNVQEKKEGQINLANLIKQLTTSNILPLMIPSPAEIYLNSEHIQSLRGAALKSNEDALDAIICLYIAALHELGVDSSLYGNKNEGYIWVPTVKCI